MRFIIDLNADVGERLHALRDGSEEALIRMISSANIACGAHAGDESTMAHVIKLCQKYGVAIGAHPGYPDRANFGRVVLMMSQAELSECVFQQVAKLHALACEHGAELQHVKPHGALYNVAAKDERVAEAVALGVARCSRELFLVGLAGSAMLSVWQGMGFRVAAEAFVDRRYEADGALRARSHQDALIHDPEIACQQALRIITMRYAQACDGASVVLAADTLCVHSDTPNAVAILTTLREQFTHEDIVVTSFTKRRQTFA